LAVAEYQQDSFAENLLESSSNTHKNQPTVREDSVLVEFQANHFAETSFREKADTKSPSPRSNNNNKQTVAEDLVTVEFQVDEFGERPLLLTTARSNTSSVGKEKQSATSGFQEGNYGEQVLTTGFLAGNCRDEKLPLGNTKKPKKNNSNSDNKKQVVVEDLVTVELQENNFTENPAALITDINNSPRIKPSNKNKKKFEGEFLHEIYSYSSQNRTLGRRCLNRRRQNGKIIL